LKSEFDRASAKSSGRKSDDKTLIILDSLNYIKGYRYELYCISKAVGESHGVIWIMGSSDDNCRRASISPSDELAKERNRERKKNQSKSCDGYYEDDETMDALALRFEPPDEKNRWEKPLYKVDVTSVEPWNKGGSLGITQGEGTNATKDISSENQFTNEIKPIQLNEPNQQPASKPEKLSSGFKRNKKATQQRAQSQSTLTVAITEQSTASYGPMSMASRNLSVSSGGAIGNDKRRIEDVIDGILNSFLMNVQPLKEGMSTSNQVSAESNVLNQVDNVTQRINAEILKAQKLVSISTGVGGRILISVGPVSKEKQRAMQLSQPLYMNELRTFRRQFLKWIAGHPLPERTEEDEVAEVYISYIESRI